MTSAPVALSGVVTDSDVASLVSATQTAVAQQRQHVATPTHCTTMEACYPPPMHTCIHVHTHSYMHTCTHTPPAILNISLATFVATVSTDGDDPRKPLVFTDLTRSHQRHVVRTTDTYHTCSVKQISSCVHTRTQPHTDAHRHSASQQQSALRCQPPSKPSRTIWSTTSRQRPA